MIENISGVDLHYEVAGDGPDVLLLHGWGQNIAMMQPLMDYLSPWFRVWNFDLPGGAGTSSEPPTPWTVYDYTDMLHTFITQHDIKNPILIGHSFGGRLSIIYAAKYQTAQKVVLLDAAGVKPKRKIDYYVKIYTYKLGKKILSLPGLKKFQNKFINKGGSADYQQASPIMKQTLSKVVNEDLQYLMPDIKVPTLLIWGALDDATPVSDAKIMETKIPNAGLVILEGAGHYAYLERLPQVQRILYSFLIEATEKNKN